MTLAPTAAARHTVPVNLGARSYEVVVGPDALDALGERLAPWCPRGRAFVLADETVAQHHGARLNAVLERENLSAPTLTIAPGEESKSWAGLERACDFLLAEEMERGETVLAFGGGVVGDLAGFAAAILKRGVRFVQIPTTLLAQVDSSVGGKTAINSRQGKNLIGAFHQPSLVIADTTLLKSLPARDWRAGYAEIVKIAAIADAAFFAWLEENGANALAGHEPVLSEAIARAVALKAAIVAADEREAGRRALLNFGHTFGHALEAAAGYASGLRHGEAVAAGMALASAYAARCGVCSQDDATRITAAIAAAGLPAASAQTPGAPFDPDHILTLMGHDKKVVDGRMRLILPHGVGAAEAHDVEDLADLRAFLADHL